MRQRVLVESLVYECVSVHPSITCLVAPSIEGVASLPCARLLLSQSCVYKRPSLRTLAVSDYAGT